MDIDDAELGVMETIFMDVSFDGVVTYREKFKIFSEEGGTAGNLVLFLSSEREEKISGSEGSVDWIGMESSEEQEKELIGELNLHFYGVSAASSSPASSSSSAQRNSPRKPVIRAEILSIGEGKEVLSIPEDFFRAWRNIENAISKSGMYLENEDQEKGVYIVLYYPDPENVEKKSLLKRLAFWESDDADGIEFHISLTGVGDKTEVVVLDDEDNWSTSQDASRILSILQTQYNRLLN